MFYQIIKHGAKVKNHPPPSPQPHLLVFKTKVLHFRVKNTYSKKHNWEEKVQMNAQLSFCGLGKPLVTKSSFEEFNDVSLPHGGVQNVLF